MGIFFQNKCCTRTSAFFALQKHSVSTQSQELTMHHKAFAALPSLSTMATMLAITRETRQAKRFVSRFMKSFSITVFALTLFAPLSNASADNASDNDLGTNFTNASNTAFCLDVPGNNAVNGQNLQMWRCNGTIAQRFEFVGDQIFHVGSGLCLDIENNGGTGTAVQLWDCVGVQAQQWSVKKDTVGAAVCLPLINDPSKFNKCRNTTKHFEIDSHGRCLDRRGGDGQLRNGQAVQVWRSPKCGEVRAQQWK